MGINLSKSESLQGLSEYALQLYNQIRMAINQGRIVTTEEICDRGLISQYLQLRDRGLVYSTPTIVNGKVVNVVHLGEEEY
ncbi:MAG: hypothetical protein QXY45_02020 [Candidatus Aenigmatarchaeota archaeon]